MLPEIRQVLILNVMTRMQSTGDTLTRACDQCGISYAVYWNTVRHCSVLQGLHDEALAISEDILADRLVNVNETVPDPKMASVISKNIQWLLSRRRPHKYGDRIVVQHETSRDKIIIARLLAAKTRILTMLNTEPVEDAVEITTTPSDQEALTLLGLG